MKLSPEDILEINEERELDIASAWTMVVDPHHCLDPRCRNWHAGTVNVGINVEDPARLQFFCREVDAFDVETVTLMLTKAQVVELIQDLRAAVSELS